MKHLLLNRAFLLGLGLLFTHIACAQWVGDRQDADFAVYDDSGTYYLENGYCPHEISFWSAGGVSSLQSRPVSGKTAKRFGAAFGLGYTYFLNRNWGLSSGLEYAFYQAKTGIDGFADTYKTVDIYNNPVFYTTLVDPYSEKQFAGFFNIPLSVVYQAGGNHLFFASAGLKFGLPVSGKYSGSDAVLTASGYYPDYDQREIWQNNLGYGRFYLSENKGKLDLGVSVMGTLETGVKWNTGAGTSLSTGIFMDFGFNNILKSDYSEKTLVEYNRNVPGHPVMNTACVLTKRAVPLLFGLKVKMAFSIVSRDSRASKSLQQSDGFYDFENPVQEEDTVKPAPAVAVLDTVVPLDTLQTEIPGTEQAADSVIMEERRAYLEAAKERRRKYSRSMSGFSLRSMGNYNRGIVSLTADQEAALDDYIVLMMENPLFTLDITGHTCDLGRDELNMRIGRERADLAKDYMVEKGIAPSRIQTFSKGKTEPLFPNNSEENRKKNRRLEIVIHKI